MRKTVSKSTSQLLFKSSFTQKQSNATTRISHFIVKDDQPNWKISDRNCRKSKNGITDSIEKRKTLWYDKTENYAIQMQCNEVIIVRCCCYFCISYVEVTQLIVYLHLFLAPVNFFFFLYMAVSNLRSHFILGICRDWLSRKFELVS